MVVLIWVLQLFIAVIAAMVCLDGKDISKYKGPVTYARPSGYMLPGFSEQYPLSHHMMHQGLLGGSKFMDHINTASFVALFKKLNCGGNVSIAVFGGSFTCGRRLNKEKGEQSWQIQFIDWMRENYPQSNIHHLDKAVSSSTSTLGFSVLHEMLLKKTPIDLILFDYSMNDHMLVWTNHHSNKTLLWVIEGVVRLAIENEIPIILQSVYMREDSAERAYTAVGSYYRIPVVSYRMAVMKNHTAAIHMPTYNPAYHYNGTRMSIFYPDSIKSPHPPLPTHMLLADYVSHVIMWMHHYFHDAQYAVSGDEPMGEPQFGGSLVSSDTDDEMAATQVCSPHTKQYSSLNGDNTLQTFALWHNSECWSYGVDIPGKPPGWIAGGNVWVEKPIEDKKRTMGYQAAFVNGRVTLTYLQSYENSGKLLVYILGALVTETGPYSKPTSPERMKEHPNLIPCCGEFGDLSTYSVVIDTFDNSTRASSIVQKTLHFDITGVQNLVLQHVSLSEQEFKERGGDKVKLLGVTTC